MYIDVLQNQWIILALIGGTVLVLYMVLGYLAMWKPRSEIEARPAPPGEEAPSGAVPWVIIFTLVAMVIFMLIYVAARSSYPPNW